MFKKQAFTLPELMVVVLIMAVLMAVAVPMFLRAKARSEAKACRATLTLIDSAKKEWALDNPNLVSQPGRPNPTDSDLDGDGNPDRDLDRYIDGGYADLPVCPFDTSDNPTPFTSYDVGDMNNDPDCTRVTMSIDPCSSGPDGQNDNGDDDDHRLP